MEPEKRADSSVLPQPPLFTFSFQKECSPGGNEEFVIPQALPSSNVIFSVLGQLWTWVEKGTLWRKKQTGMLSCSALGAGLGKRFLF